MQLIVELATATALVAVTCTVHLLGIGVLMVLLGRRHHPDRIDLLRQAVAIGVAAGGLFVLHAVEIWLYAAFYFGVSALPGLEPALYFSTASFTTVGYGDVVLTPAWRVVGAIESANGIILLGWSTAFFIAIVGRIRWLEAEMQASR
ncbi:potassium channel family protein [Sphingomonas melonis]|uniref:potassium channel family protein n=1 Tax=Sphingomonas melonis TaxID=152682 RepID=UPI0036956A84